MSTFTATLSTSPEPRNSRYTGWIRAKLSPGTTITTTTTVGITIAIGDQSMTIELPNPDPASGELLAGQQSMIYSGTDGEVTVSFSAWSAGGLGFFSIDGFDEVYDSSWEQTYLEGAGWQINIESPLTAPADSGSITGRITLDANPNKLEWPENAGTLTTESSAEWARLADGIAEGSEGIPEYRYAHVEWDANTTATPRTCRIQWTLSNPEQTGFIDVNQAAAEPPPSEPATLSVVPDTIGISWQGGRCPIQVESTGPWRAAAPEWVTLSQESGTGDALHMSAVIAQNEKEQSRSGDISFSYGDNYSQILNVSVTQSRYPGDPPPRPRVVISPTRVSASSSAGEAEIAVTFSNCKWAVSGEPEWMAVTTADDANGFTIAYTANTSTEPRRTTLRLLVPTTVDGDTPTEESGAVLNFTQAAWSGGGGGGNTPEPEPGTPAPEPAIGQLYVTLAPDAFPYPGGTATLIATFSGVDPDDVRLTVTGDWLVSGEPTITDTTKTWTLTAPDNTGGLWRPATLTVSVGELWQTINTAQVTGGVAMKLLPGTLFAGENRVQFFL